MRIQRKSFVTDYRMRAKHTILSKENYKMDWKSLGFFVLDRLKEPSTYAGIAGLIAASHLMVDPALITALSGVGMAGASAVAIAVKEGR
jgi:hypothetical protein